MYILRVICGHALGKIASCCLHSITPQLQRSLIVHHFWQEGSVPIPNRNFLVIGVVIHDMKFGYSVRLLMFTSSVMYAVFSRNFRHSTR